MPCTVPASPFAPVPGGVEQRVYTLHKEERERVGEKHERKLDRELVHRFRDRHLVVAGEGRECDVIPGVLSEPSLEDPLAAQPVQINDAADARGHKAHRGHGKAKARAVFKAPLHFVVVAPVVRLPRPLAVAHREKQTGGIEAADGVIEPDRHDQSEHRLQKISVHDRDAGVKRAGAGAAVGFLLGIAQRERGKAETETVIREDFQRAGGEERVVETPAGNGVGKQQQKAAEHGARDQRLADKGTEPAENVGRDHRRKQQRERQHKAPYVGVPEMHSGRHSLVSSLFSMCRFRLCRTFSKVFSSSSE